MDIGQLFFPTKSWSIKGADKSTRPISSLLLNKHFLERANQEIHPGLACSGI